jgi:DNA primase large subunit
MAMFKPTSRHNFSTGPGLGGPSTYPEVKLNRRSSNQDPSETRYRYRLNLYVPQVPLSMYCQICIVKHVLTENSYDKPPILDITLEEFETFAITRLRILSYIESLQHRNLPYPQFQAQIAGYLKTHLPLSSSTAKGMAVEKERRADEIGHWVLRLAFCRS